MSQGERMLRLQESSNRYLSRRQTKDASQQTLINQAKASKVVFPGTQTPTSQAIATSVVIVGSQVPGARDSSIGHNVYSADGAPIGCCATSVTSGSETWSGSQGLAQQKEGCAICANPDYATQNGYAIDMNAIGGNCCPLPNLPNTAKVPGYIQCSTCLKFYFPNPAQPRSCACQSGTPYASQYLYPPPPESAEQQRYGDIRVPQHGP
jgi:hypothetical protein